MKNFKLSPWHSGDVKPVHDGVYERDYSKSNFPADASQGIKYCAFKNGYWRIFNDTITGANNSSFNSVNKNLPWRGILK